MGGVSGSEVRGGGGDGLWAISGAERGVVDGMVFGDLWLCLKFLLVVEDACGGRVAGFIYGCSAGIESFAKLSRLSKLLWM